MYTHNSCWASHRTVDGFYFLVEGPDDQRFCERIIQPAIERLGLWIKIVPYAEMKRTKVAKLLQNIENRANIGYVFLADADFAPCASSKKELIAALREIECWYLAGLGSEACRDFRVPLHTETHHLTKEVFDRLIPRRFDSRTD